MVNGSFSALACRREMLRCKVAEFFFDITHDQENRKEHTEQEVSIAIFQLFWGELQVCKSTSSGG